MLSRQTLGRPGAAAGAGAAAADTAVYGIAQSHQQHHVDTLNSRSIQGGAGTIVTQFGRDNLDGTSTANNAAGAGGYDEIDDLRRA